MGLALQGLLRLGWNSLYPFYNYVYTYVYTYNISMLVMQKILEMPFFILQEHCSMLA